MQRLLDKRVHWEKNVRKSAGYQDGKRPSLQVNRQESKGYRQKTVTVREASILFEQISVNSVIVQAVRRRQSAFALSIVRY